MTQVKDLVDAYDAFITGCKADGTWSAIKASCIMAGWDNLNGALTPLVGAAPTNFNFVIGDYNRKTGLIGNGSSKHLNTNRADNADPQNDAHVSIYVFTPGSKTGSNNEAYIGASNNVNSYRELLRVPASNGTFAYVRTAAGASGGTLNAVGFLGASRSGSTSFVYRREGTPVTISQTSAAPSSNTVGVFAERYTSVINYTTARLSFYSLGESLDLALLDSRVTQLMTGIASALPLDVDAAAYISAVEAADGQSLEPGVKLAIDRFVVGCKDDGIWSAIKASCILAGARTLAGALVPLAGTAPTNNNFVAGDYNRKTGLDQNSDVSKWLDSNYSNQSASRQNNNHQAVWATKVQDGIFLLGNNYGTGGDVTLGTGSTTVRPTTRNMHSSASVPTNDALVANSLFGSSRSASNSYAVRVNGQNYVLSIVSASPTTGNIGLFRLSQTSSFAASDTRFAFYSIGESLDLALLDSRVTQLMTGIASALPLDVDAAAYISAVEAADGQSLEPGVKLAIDRFVVGCKDDGIWSAIKASCILAGARTLAGALVPLVGTAPTNNNFVSGDYSRTTGLVGDGSTKYLDSNRASNADPQDSHHLSIYASTAPTVADVVEIGAVNGSETSQIGRVIGRTEMIMVSRRLNSSVPQVAVNISNTGFRGVSRPNSTTINARAASSNFVLSESSVATGANTTNIFRRGGGGYGPSNGRYSFYSIGESLDLTLLDSRVTTLMSDIAAAIP